MSLEEENIPTVSWTNDNPSSPLSEPQDSIKTEPSSEVRSEFERPPSRNDRSPPPNLPHPSNTRSPHPSDTHSPRHMDTSHPSDENTPPSQVLALFNLHNTITEQDISDFFTSLSFPPSSTTIPRGKFFAFVDFGDVETATKALAEVSSAPLIIGNNSNHIRIDFSKTLEPHKSTPGRYMGRPVRRSFERHRDFHPVRSGSRLAPPEPYRDYRRYRDEPRRDSYRRDFHPRDDRGYGPRDGHRDHGYYDRVPDRRDDYGSSRGYRDDRREPSRPYGDYYSSSYGRY
ncbi:hypothetical protein GEMRC1_012031 [Eukaryota sp. GEM-RC1]